MNTFICSKCEQELPETELNHNTSRYGMVCMSCVKKNQREYARKYRAEGKHLIKVDSDWYVNKYNMYLKYRLRPEDIIRMYEEQNGLCAICGKEKARVVDHDHNTGEVRALLCVNCNLFIGNAQEDIEILKNAISYLQKYDCR